MESGMTEDLKQGDRVIDVLGDAPDALPSMKTRFGVVHSLAPHGVHMNWDADKGLPPTYAHRDRLRVITTEEEYERKQAVLSDRLARECATDERPVSLTKLRAACAEYRGRIDDIWLTSCNVRGVTYTPIVARHFVDDVYNKEPDIDPRARMEHLAYLVEQIPKYYAQNSPVRAMRLLGWVQGVFWRGGHETLDEARKVLGLR